MNQPHQQPSKNTPYGPFSTTPTLSFNKNFNKQYQKQKSPNTTGLELPTSPQKRKSINKQPATLPAPYCPVVQSEITARAAEARSKPAPAPPSEKQGRSGDLRHG